MQRGVKTHTIFLVEGTYSHPKFIALDGPLLLLEIICRYTQGSIHPQYIRYAANAQVSRACTASLLETYWSYPF